MSELDIEQYKITEEPFYEAQGDEVKWYQAAYDARLPVMVKGQRVVVSLVLSNTWHINWVNR